MNLWVLIMTTYLLDSNVVIRWLNAKKLSHKVIRAIENPKNNIFISCISLFEIETKRHLGKLDMPQSYVAILNEYNFEIVDFTQIQAMNAGNLPWYHKDPFDRILVAQAKDLGATLITSDTNLSFYDINILEP